MPTSRYTLLQLVNSQWLWNDNYILYTTSGSYTEWFTRYHKVTFPAVTQGVLDSGLVLVYMTPNLSDNSQWSPLPYTFETGLGYSYDFVYVTGPGSVELEFYFGKQIQYGYPADAEYLFVCQPIPLSL